VSPVTFLPLADDDLVAAWLHIATDNPTAADNYLDHIYNVCALITDNPKMGVDRGELGDGVRSFSVENHVIFYVANADGITVLRVWPAALDAATFIL
jgi:plasmid stabilization system protein ParE